MFPRILNQFLRECEKMREELYVCARLHSLEVLSHSSLKAKAQAAKMAYLCFDSATAINGFLLQYFNVRREIGISWPSNDRLDESLLVNGKIDEDNLPKRVRGYQLKISQTLNHLQTFVENYPLIEPARTMLDRLALNLPNVDLSALSNFSLPEDILNSNAQQHPKKVFAGPRSVNIDQAFKPTFSLLRSPVPGFGDTLEEAVPYFWGLAIRESLAADLCALSIIEYDGLPPQFYLDMSKQCWDEMRHSQYFFDLAIKLFDELEKEVTPDHPLAINIREFRETGSGLPIPKEKNLYEAILNASLVERLILLHRDTETPGIKRLKEKIDSEICVKYPEIAESLEIILRDEITHSQFGNKWLEFLLPDIASRNAIIEQTELLRGVYLLSAFVHHGEESLGTLMMRFANGEIAPISSIH